MKQIETLVFPTDTVYGLACIPTKEALEKIYIIKQRDKSKKIIALISDISNIKEITNDIDYNIVEKFFPGPLSIICKSNERFKELVGNTIGIRMPNNKLTRDIIRKYGGILMVTSANISGEPSPKKFSEIPKEIISNVNIVYKDDKNLSGIPSTIISFIDNKYELIREGEIKFEDIIKEAKK